MYVVKSVSDPQSYHFTETVLLKNNCQHENIVRFIGIANFKNSSFIVMEQTNTESFEIYLTRNNNLDIIKKIKFLRDCIEALLYLEDNHLALL